MTKLKKRIYRGGMVAAVLAVAAVPLSASAVTTNTVINASVGSTISISSVSPVSINLSPGSSPVVSSASDTVSVSTNNTTGYTLTLANNDTNRDLVSAGADTIAPSAGTAAAPVVLADNTWGFAIAGTPFDTTYTAENNNDSSTSLWAGVPSSASPVQIKNHGTTASGDTTTVWYGVRVDASQPTGTYTDTVTYSATTNP